MQKHDCIKSEKIEIIYSELLEVRKDVKKILAYRSYVAGAAGVVGAIASFAISFIVKNIN